MKTLYHLLLTTITLLPITSFSQSKQDTYRINYELIYQIDSTDATNLKTELMLLDFTTDISVFKSSTTHLKDSILKSNNPQALLGVSKSEFRYKIYKNNKKLISLYDYAAYKYEINEDLPVLKWETASKTKEILGYQCFLAKMSFKGRDYEAWYTPDISISEGPYKFQGLPGLILEIYDTKNHYHFTALGIQKIESGIKIDDQEYTKISKKEHLAFLEKIREKPSLILYNPGINIPKEGLDGYDRKHRERNKYKNNPIELTDN